MLNKFYKINNITYFNSEWKNISINIEMMIKEEEKVLMSNIVKTGFFYPGDGEKLEQWLAENLEISLDEAKKQPIIDIMKTIWTEELIKNYQNHITNQEII